MRARTQSVAACLSICLLTTSLATAKQPIRKLKYDNRIPAVDLFDAIDNGLVETTVVAKSVNEASLFVTNKSDNAVSVKLPQAVVAVQVLKQFFPQGNNNNVGLNQGGNRGQGGAAQPLGAGPQGNNNNANNGPGQNGQGNGFNNNQGNNFFCVPSQKTIQVPLRTLCLAHGRPEPRAKMTYRLVKLEDYTGDRVLQETLKLFASGQTDAQSAQAAVWHLTDKMSWDDLRAKQIDRLGLDPVLYFDARQVDDAEKLIETARTRISDVSPRSETR